MIQNLPQVVEVLKVIPQQQGQPCAVEQIGEVPVPQVVEESWVQVSPKETCRSLSEEFVAEHKVWIFFLPQPMGRLPRLEARINETKERSTAKEGTPNP